MQVRVATIEDIPSLIEIARQFIVEAPNYSKRELNETALDQNFRSVMSGAGAIFLVESKNQIVGGIVCLTTTDWFNDQVIAFEQVFYVCPEYRATRAPFLLLDSFISWAKHMNAGRIQCGTTTGINTKGCIRLYQHFGFSEYGTVLDLELKA